MVAIRECLEGNAVLLRSFSKRQALICVVKHGISHILLGIRRHFAGGWMQVVQRSSRKS